MKTSNNIQNPKIYRSDIVGILASSLCLIHCLLMPLVLLLFTETIGEKYEQICIFFWFISFISVFLSIEKMKNKKLKFTLIISWLLLTISLFYEEKHPVFKLFIYLGSIALIAIHIVNIKNCIKCLPNSISKND